MNDQEFQKLFEERIRTIVRDEVAKCLAQWIRPPISPVKRGPGRPRKDAV